MFLVTIIYLLNAKRKDKYSTKPSCTCPLDEWRGREKNWQAGITHVHRQISFKKEMKVEDLKIETLETLHDLGSLGALGYEHSLKTDGKKNLNSSLKVSNMTQIQGGISQLKPWDCISLKNTKPLERSENRYQVLFIKMEGQQLEMIILLV